MKNETIPKHKGPVKGKSMKFAAPFLVLLFLACGMAFAQMPRYPEGCYMSFEEIRKKSPSQQMDVIMEERTEGEIKMNGGNDYQLVSADGSHSRKTLKKDTWAYSDGVNLYLNCFQFKLQTWYALVTGDGKYLVMMAGIPNDQVMYTEEMQMGVAFGAIGGAVAGAAIAMKRFLYAIDKESMKVFPIDEKSIKKILAEDPDLLDAYNAEKNPANPEILVLYLELLNAKYLP